MADLILWKLLQVGHSESPHRRCIVKGGAHSWPAHKGAPLIPPLCGGGQLGNAAISRLTTQQNMVVWQAQHGGGGRRGAELGVLKTVKATVRL